MKTYLHILWGYCWCVCFLVAATQALAQTEARFALIIGNGNYGKPTYNLRNPVNDARAIANSLENYQFQVQIESNLNKEAMDNAITKFVGTLKQARQQDKHVTALFYYSGHGIQIDKTNYLIPVKIDITQLSQVKYNTLRLQEAIDRIAEEAHAQIVMVDACRDNPFPWERSTKDLATVGLANEETHIEKRNDFSNLVRGLFISYAAAPNKVASQGNANDRNSPYVKAFIETLKNYADQNLVLLFHHLKDKVKEYVNTQEAKNHSEDLEGHFYFKKPVTPSFSPSGKIPKIGYTGDSIAKIANMSIDELKSLTTLDLRNKGLITLPADISVFTNLTTLYLSNNKLESLPAEIGKLTNLTKLGLYNCELTSLPAEIGKLTNLISLNLTLNRLTSVPAEIVELKNLKFLSVSSNRLTSLPAEIGKLTNLTRLDLYNCELTSLPAEIGKLTNLDTLELSYNKLTSLPVEIAKLTNLTELRLMGNKAINLSNIDKLTNLTYLHLGYINLRSVPVEIGKLTNLTELFLNENQLTSLPIEITNLKKLKTLHLGDNNFSRAKRKNTYKLLPHVYIRF